MAFNFFTAFHRALQDPEEYVVSKRNEFDS